MKTIGKCSLLICFAIAICVFQYDQFIIRFGISWSVMRVCWHGCNPQSPLIVKGKLDRVSQITKFFFRGKQRYLVSGSHLKFIKSILTIQVFRLSVFILRIIISLNFRKFGSRRIGRSQIILLAFGHLPNCLIAVGGHFPDFLNFSGIILGSERIIPSSIGMNAIGNFYILVPHPVFFLNRHMYILPPLF